MMMPFAVLTRMRDQVKADGLGAPAEDIGAPAGMLVVGAGLHAELTEVRFWAVARNSQQIRDVMDTYLVRFCSWLFL